MATKTPLTCFTSRSVTVLPGAAHDFTFDFIPHDSRRGMRYAAHRIEIECTGNIDASCASAIQGEDYANLAKHVLLKDSKGNLIDLNGDELRCLTRALMGEATPDDPADLTAGQAATTRVYTHVIPCAIPLFERAKDFAVPHDHLKAPDALLRVTAPSSSQIQGINDNNINSTTGVTVRLKVWSAEEWAFETHSRWVALSQSTEADDRFAVKGISNVPLILLGMHKAGASGGSVMTNVSGIDSQLLNMRNVLDEDLEEAFRMARRSGGYYSYSKDPWEAGTDDAANSKAFPILFTPYGSKITQLPIVGSPPEIEVSGTAITSKKVLKCYVTQPSTVDVQDSASARGVDLSKLKPKTSSGKAMAPNDPYRAFVSQKVPGRSGRFSRR